MRYRRYGGGGLQNKRTSEFVSFACLLLQRDASNSKKVEMNESSFLSFPILTLSLLPCFQTNVSFARVAGNSDRGGRWMNGF